MSQVIGCEDRLRNDLYFVGWWGVKLYSNQTLVSALCYDVIHDVFVLFTFAQAEVIFFYFGLRPKFETGSPSRPLAG